ncbi:MAG TPA: N-acetyl-gamma-glutamyl-phosphate reductase [Candidatus Saccharimonadales bacterium]|nr:N-acetyl-gamma-glutamyl-phosphate reductase [Candidatus Saccharimonadales bacterium]
MGNSKVSIGIVGISGYSGRELLRLLLEHPYAEVTYVSANKTAGPVSAIWPQFAGKSDLVCGPYDAAAAAQTDLVFLATPHTVSMRLAPELLEKGVRVIDMSGDFRLASEAEYTRWYKAEEHSAPHLLDDAVYGLPEVYAGQLKDARLVANPGCYPTAGILSAAPLARRTIQSIHIDAKSGVSGAGITKAEALLKDMEDNFKAYKVLQHQHSPEIVEQLSFLAGRPLPVAFVPHLLPFERGIFATTYITLEKAIAQEEAQELFEDFYKDKPFVEVVPAGDDVAIKDIVATNDLRVHIAADPAQNLVVVTAVLDNLIKGASGQAVQNLNLMYGFDETTGLR